MDKKKIMKWGGIAGVVAGSSLLYLSGASESTVTGIVAAVFVLGGVIAAVFKS